jgi:non-ribosomal peptide synthetase-like protein
MPIFPAFYIFDRLADWFEASFGFGYMKVLPLLAWPTAMALIVITVGLIAAIRWMVLPSVKPGTYSVHGGFYFRKWIVALCTELTLETLSSLYATVYMRAWYRLMGAKIGKGSEISTNLSGRYDLIDIGEKCFVADEVVLGDETVRRGWMQLEPVHTGDRVFVGNEAVVPPGTDIPSGSLIGIKSKPPSNEEMATSPRTGPTSRRAGASWAARCSRRSRCRCRPCCSSLSAPSPSRCWPRPSWPRTTPPCCRSSWRRRSPSRSR